MIKSSFWGVGVACLVGALTFAAPCHAGTINVNTTVDTVNGPNCTLRSALFAAYFKGPSGGCTGATAGHNTINLPAGTYTLTSKDAQNLIVPLTWLYNVTIAGAGAGSTIVNGNGVKASIFNVYQSSVITGVTIKGSGVAYQGGGITVQNGQALTLGNSEVSFNKAGLSGGGIYIGSGTNVWIYGSYIHDNYVDSFGGGITAATGSYLELDNSTITANTAGSQGGGLVLGGTSYVTQCTIGANSASTNGGGIYWTGGSVYLSGSTVAFNTLSTNGNGPGIFAQAGTAFYISRTAVTDNKAGAAYMDIMGTLRSYGYNYIPYKHSSTSWLPQPGATGDIIDGHVLSSLGTLGSASRNSPFYLPAYKPNSGSPLLEKAAWAYSADQLGSPRDPDNNGKQDIGAIERQ